LQVFQLFRTYVASVFLFGRFKTRSGCYTCCNMTHPGTTACYSYLGAVHARGGAE
jgi:hypothetical protein